MLAQQKLANDESKSNQIGIAKEVQAMGDETKLPIKNLDLDITESNILDGAGTIIRLIKPAWDVSQTTFVNLTDGLTNKLVMCRLINDVDEKDVVLIRVYGTNTDLLIDREKEKRNLINLNCANLAPKLYGTFNNGLIYEYKKGCILTAETVVQPDIARLVAEKIACLHRVKFGDAVEVEPMLWKMLNKFHALIPDKYTSQNTQLRYDTLLITNKNQLHDEIKYLNKLLACESSEIVFCHNDLLLANVIYDASECSVTFIDFEYADFNYQAFDIANHFAEFPGVESVNYDLYPDDAFQVAFIQWYLNAYKAPHVATQADVRLMVKQVQKFVLAAHLLWVLWALVQAEYSVIEFDYLEYAAIRLKEYYRCKKSLMPADGLNGNHA